MWDWAAQRAVHIRHVEIFFSGSVANGLAWSFERYSVGSGWGGPEARFNDRGPADYTQSWQMQRGGWWAAKRNTRERSTTKVKSQTSFYLNSN
jgi:hypothetical protein